LKKTRNNKVELTAGEIAKTVGASLEGNASVKISGAAPIESAEKDEITFVANTRYQKFLTSTRAGAVVVDDKIDCSHKTILRHPNPYFTFAQIIDLLYPDEPIHEAAISPLAYIDDSAVVAPTVNVGNFCHIESGSRIGEHTRLVSSVYIGKNVSIGNNCLLYPGVIILDNSIIGNHVIIHASTVVGSDGFGYAPTKQGIKKIKQVGWVEIGDNVELGSNVSIDRGALGPTQIGRGTKIDNLVQIAHNVQIGENCLIVAQVGISGSTKVGNGVTIAGQVGLVGHIEIGDGAIIGAQSGVSNSVPAGRTFFGYPAREIMETKRIEASLTRLPELLKRVKQLEKKLEDKSGN
jgi:UDP-3-O-[3-hydroxymyristoyl] glucosamine N-acyltransferase